MNDERRAWRFEGVVLKEEARRGHRSGLEEQNNQPTMAEEQGWSVKRQCPYARFDAEEEEMFVERGVGSRGSGLIGDEGGNERRRGDC